MSSLLSVLNIASTSLMAQTAGLNVTSNNVANATTPGYVRESAVLAEQVLGSQAGGVAFTGINRNYDQFAFHTVATQGGLLGAATARSSALETLQSTLAPSSSSIDTQISAFFAASQTLTSTPTDTGARQQFLDTANQLAQSVSTTAQGIKQQRSDMLAQAQGVASDVNQSLTQIAKLDQQIQEANGSGNDASGLRDQRGVLVQNVASKIGAQAIEDGKGHFTLLSSGVALVSDNTATQLGVTVDTTGNLAFSVQSNGVTTDITKNVTSGTLGGVREARDTDCVNAAQQLDQFAYDFATTVNKVHAAGYGSDSGTGRNLFVQPTVVTDAAASMGLDPSMVGHPERVAAAGSLSELPSGNTNALALAGLSSQSLGVGTSDPTQRFATIAAGVGAAKSSADGEQSLRQSTSAQATTIEQSTEGVNTDEEMVNLAQYQTAFQASQKVLTVTNQLLGELMQAF